MTLPLNDAVASIVDHDGQHFLAIAKQATAMAGDIIRSNAATTATLKGERDYVSDVDVTVEKTVRNFLYSQLPESGFLGEEEGGDNIDENFTWVLDPIDGTVNFLHGLPLCAVSLSLVYNGCTIAGIVDAPFLGARYSGLLGHGSFVNDERLLVSSTRTLDSALVSIDQFTFGAAMERRNLMRRQLVEQLGKRAQRVRMLGASAIDLAWMAQGNLDACVVLGNKPWDTSAGVLIAREAGARVLDEDGSEHSPESGATIAVTPTLEIELMNIVYACFVSSK